MAIGMKTKKVREGRAKEKEREEMGAGIERMDHFTNITQKISLPGKLGVKRQRNK